MGTLVSRCGCCGTGPSGQVAPGSSSIFWKASAVPPAGLSSFAVVQSYLSTAAQWRIHALGALTELFTEGPPLPAAIRPG